MSNATHNGPHTIGLGSGFKTLRIRCADFLVGLNLQQFGKLFIRFLDSKSGQNSSLGYKNFAQTSIKRDSRLKTCKLEVKAYQRVNLEQPLFVFSIFGIWDEAPSPGFLLGTRQPARPWNIILEVILIQSIH
ncbi:unnamed protein product [Cuscuta campestris]|uniref:Uncharacterized protein n=1 Tax=Cuscuta campestris TaxID=132261 RepID=A0A484N9H7_9ASTE|nr:unnamed protein product [Cuscuta campestris]